MMLLAVGAFLLGVCLGMLVYASTTSRRVTSRPSDPAGSTAGGPVTPTGATGSYHLDGTRR